MMFSYHLNTGVLASKSDVVMMTLSTFLSQAVSNTHQEMNRAFGQRLGEMVTSSSFREHHKKSQQRIPVEEIVAKK